MKRAEIIKNLYEEINKANFDVLDSTLDFEKFQCFIPNRSSMEGSKSFRSMEL